VLRLFRKTFYKKTTEKAIRRGKDGVKKQSTRKDGKKIAQKFLKNY